MELNSLSWPIQKVLGSKNTYLVPEYQREFSWRASREVKELYFDIVNHVSVRDDSLKVDQHFLGTMIFEGDITAPAALKKKIYVIDGQQRLTAITVFLKALADSFEKEGLPSLAQAILQNYIVATDDDGVESPIFTNETPQPFFRLRIQGKGHQAQPSTEEEERIEQTYKFFMGKLASKELLKRFVKSDGSSFPRGEIYKAIRDQILACVVIAIWTSDGQYATSIFETMNAKGLELAPVDLIKNRVFALCKSEGDNSAANAAWKKLVLQLEHHHVPLDVFFAHYWCARYGLKKKGALFSDFKKQVKSFGECIDLLNEMYSFSIAYSNCLFPSISIFENKKQCASCVTYLTVLSKRFSLVMPRPFLMVAYKKYCDGVVPLKMLRRILGFLARFHFVYSAVCSLRTNALESFYSNAATSLYAVSSEQDASKAIEELISNLKGKLPSYESFLDRIKTVKFSNKNESYKMDTRAKFFLSWLATKNGNPEIFEPEDLSVEHLFGDTDADADILRLPYLLPLEKDRNSGAPSSWSEKRETYKGSRFPAANAVGQLIRVNQDEENLKRKLCDLFERNCKSFFDELHGL